MNHIPNWRQTKGEFFSDLAHLQQSYFALKYTHTHTHLDWNAIVQGWDAACERDGGDVGWGEMEVCQNAPAVTGASTFTHHSRTAAFSAPLACNSIYIQWKITTTCACVRMIYRSVHAQCVRTVICVCNDVYLYVCMGLLSYTLGIGLSSDVN